MGNYIYKSAVAIASLIRNGSATSTKVVKEHLDHIKKHNPDLNAVVVLSERTAK